MSAAANPYLLAVILVTQARTGSGAQVVFHYPPHPLSDQETKLHGEKHREDDESSSTDSNSESSSDDNDFQAFIRRTKPAPQRDHDQRAQTPADDKQYSESTPRNQNHRPGKPSWEPLLALGEEGLASLLAPGRAWHKRRFEMSINDLVFLGRPVYARANGTWRHRQRSRATNAVEDDRDQPSDTATESEQDEEGKISRQKPSPNRHLGRQSPLTMFHVVFVMNPPPLEYSLRVKDMYDNVVRKFSKILKWEQAQSQYVWKQSDLIHNAKQSCLARKLSTSSLYAEVLAQSTLAVAVSTLYKAISASRIAALKLGSDVSISLQIPPITSVSYLASLTDPPQQPGLWLTTANDSIASQTDLDTATASGALQLAKQFSLLLKESPQKILKEIQATGGPLAVPLANLIDKALPTKSFHKISIANHISLADIQLLARHLINWRRAISVPPLHHRDTYIVSPIADMGKLVEASRSFEVAFPMTPSLPRILNSLSQTPTPFGTLIPSTDHKEEYYRVLAWLMRGGWVTQLRTFSYVRVHSGIKKAVREKNRGIRNQFTPTISPDKSSHNLDETIPRRPSMLSRPSSEGVQSISTETSHSRSQQKPYSTSPASMTNIHISSLILSPLRANTLESQYLSLISENLVTPSTTHTPAPFSSLTQAEREELHHKWPTLIKYFNGTEPLEMIPVREGLKRKAVWDVLGRLGLKFDGGVLDDKDENKAVIVTIRHW